MSSDHKCTAILVTMSIEAPPRGSRAGLDKTAQVLRAADVLLPDGERNGEAMARRNSNVRIARAIWSRRYWVAAIALLTGALAIFYFARNPVMYRSTAVVMFTSGQMDEWDRPLLPGEPLPPLQRLKHLATSTAVFDRLIEVHDLYRHYFIDTTAPLYHERATARLEQSIHATILDESIMAITVHDLDREKAAQLANGIFVELDGIVQQHADKHFQRQMQLHRDMVAFHESRLAQGRKELAELGAYFAPLLLNADSDHNTTVLRLEGRMAETSARLAEAESELQGLGRRMELLAAMNKNGSLGELTLVNRGMSDTSAQPRLIIAWSVLGCMLASMVVSCFLIGLWSAEGHAVKDLLRAMRRPSVSATSR